MSQVDLHGAEIVREPATRPVPRVGAGSVVGLVGAAANAGAAVSASLLIGEGNAAVVATAATAGAAGNDLSIEVDAPTAASQALAVVLDGDRIVVSLATDATGAPSTTATALVTAWAAVAGVVAKATLALAAGSSGADKLGPLYGSSLAGGLDAAAPLNEPWAVLSIGDANRLGAGTLRDAVLDAWTTCGSPAVPVVVVRTATDDSDDVAGTRAAGSGVWALLGAEAKVNLRPSYIAAPGQRSLAVVAALQAVSLELADGAAATALASADYAAAIAAGPRGGKVVNTWPKLRLLRDGVVTSTYGDAAWCGHAARVRRGGYQVSPSNKVMEGVLGTDPPVGWTQGSRASQANQLNRRHVVTAIARDGAVYSWGNRFPDGEKIAHHVTRTVVERRLLAASVEWVDADVDVPYADAVLDAMNGFLLAETRAKRLLGGRAWLDPAYNTAETLAADELTFSFDIGMKPLGEHLKFRSAVSPEYVRRLASELAGSA